MGRRDQEEEEDDDDALFNSDDSDDDGPVKEVSSKGAAKAAVEQRKAEQALRREKAEKKKRREAAIRERKAKAKASSSSEGEDDEEEEKGKGSRKRKAQDSDDESGDDDEDGDAEDARAQMVSELERELAAELDEDSDGEEGPSDLLKAMFRGEFGAPKAALAASKKAAQPRGKITKFESDSEDEKKPAKREPVVRPNKRRRLGSKGNVEVAVLSREEEAAAHAAQLQAQALAQWQKGRLSAKARVPAGRSSNNSRAAPAKKFAATRKQR